MRSVSQIYSEAVSIRNNYLQLTELNTGRSNSKLSIINLLTYVVAVCIHTYEAILDLFQVKIVETLNGRINGTPDWYAMIAKKFQYNPVTECGDEMKFNDDTLKVGYVTVDPSHRIIEKAAWQLDNGDTELILKVCKINDNSNEVKNGTPYMALSTSELTAFKMFIHQIKFVGANVYCESLPGDIITIVADNNNPIYFDDNYVTAAQALDALQQEFINFANEMEFNGVLYYQSVLDVIRKTTNIKDIGANIKVFVSQYNVGLGAYENPVQLNGRMRLKSGYIRFLNEESIMTINSDNLTLKPASSQTVF